MSPTRDHKAWDPIISDSFLCKRLWPLQLLFYKAMTPEMGRTVSHSKPSGIVVEHNAFAFDRRGQGSIRGLCRYLWRKVVQKGRLRDTEHNIMILPKNSLTSTQATKILKECLPLPTRANHTCTFLYFKELLCFMLMICYLLVMAYGGSQSFQGPRTTFNQLQSPVLLMHIYYYRCTLRNYFTSPNFHSLRLTLSAAIPHYGDLTVFAEC